LAAAYFIPWRLAKIESLRSLRHRMTMMLLSLSVIHYLLTWSMKKTTTFSGAAQVVWGALRNGNNFMGIFWANKGALSGTLTGTESALDKLNRKL
jgi:hypothetical protein